MVQDYTARPEIKEWKPPFKQSYRYGSEPTILETDAWSISNEQIDD